LIPLTIHLRQHLLLLTRSISTIITLPIAINLSIAIGITFIISHCIILHFFLLLFEVIAIVFIEVIAFVFIVEPVIGCLLLVILIVVIDVFPCHPSTTEAPIDHVLADEDDTLDALVRCTLLLACVVYDETLLIGQEGSRAGK
jgi:hypothetical protein